MKKILLIILLLFTMSFVYAESDFDLESDIDGYISNGQTIKGTITITKDGQPYAYEYVPYTLKDESGNALLNFGQVRTDDKGQASLSVKYPDVENGTYRLKFELPNHIYIIEITLSEDDYSLSMDKSSFRLSETINGRGYYKTDKDTITYSLRDVHDKIIDTFDVALVNNEFEFNYNAPNTSGSYSLNIELSEGRCAHMITVSDEIKSINVSSFNTTYTTEYGTNPSLPKKIEATKHDGTKVLLPVVWDLSNIDIRQPSTKYIEGIADDKYSVSAHLTVNPPRPKDDDDDDDDEPKKEKEPKKDKEEEIKDKIPKAGKDASKEEKKVLKDSANKMLDELKDPTADELKDVNKALNQTLKVLEPEDAVDLVADMTNAVKDNMTDMSVSEASSLVRDMLDNSYDTLKDQDDLSKKEKKALERSMTRLVTSLYEEKTAIEKETVTVSDINKAIKSIEQVEALVKNSLNDADLEVKPSILVKATDQLTLDPETVKHLAQTDMDLAVEAGDVKFTIPNALIDKVQENLNVKRDEVKTPLSKETSNGKVETLKTMDLTVNSNGQSLENVRLSFPIGDLDVDADSLMVGVYENGVWTKLDYTIEDGNIIFTAPHFSIYSVMKYETSFTDIDMWAKNYITSLAAKGIVSGKSESAYDPNGTITRAEFVTMLINHLGLDEEANINFSDASGWYESYLAIAKANGLYYGHEGNKFRPTDAITREEMAVLVNKAYEIKYGDNLETQDTPFSDHSFITEDARSAVYAMKSNEIISGYPDNSFKPQNTASRAEAATIIYQFLDK
ncbi:hypothetical protein EZV73_06075 [Acidaminobacter sp. JC074]|uniref:S-layer homology domain-containing protein n=1 Tax=Acidaminobacter sp. JC074 TaxID=2530199 RepID=UPI001F0DC958|nr:S-layer homology domain-containing protein [Acidaminobacter sp. JC074]MCH4887127.1 hypothetical protein [Acidaminobacter sp. JC074]